MGMGGIFNVMIIGSMLYRAGGSPWSVSNAIASFRANPMQLMMTVMMLSRNFM
jgi:hypothetical protein